MAKVRTPRDAWVAAATRALAAGGPDAVRVEALAAGLGVTKGGFYWHFADRRALLDEVLDTWERAMVEDVIERVEAAAGDARSRIRHLFSLAPTADFPVELALRDWARRDADVAARLREVDGRRMAWLHDLFADFCPEADEADARSLLAYSLLIGGYFIAPPRGRRSRGQALQLSLDHLLRDP